jgi:transposase
LAARKTHRCDWRDRAEALESELKVARDELDNLREKTGLLDEKIEALNQRMFGRRSERQRVPDVNAEIRKQRPSDPEQAKAKRRATEEQKKRVEAEPHRPEVPRTECQCEYCGDGPDQFQLIGSKTSTVYSMRPSKLVKRVYTRDTRACHCGKTIVSAPAPERFGKSQYDASVVAQLVTGKCSDSLPVARQAEQLRRQGIPASRATLNRLFLQAGRVLAPVALRILALISESDIVLGDETPIRQQDQDSKGYFWTFGNGDLVAYVYSSNRSGETPKKVLGGTQGVLVVDGYTGYNAVTKPDGRERAGCNSHARRKFCEALANAPEAQRAIDIYTEVFVVERDAQDLCIVGSRQHLALRRKKSAPAMRRMHAWLEQEQPRHLPKSRMGDAIGYALNNWKELTRFLTNAKIPVSNNLSEGQLRIVALGRKNFMSVGAESTGQCIATLYTLTACCKRAGIDPTAYLTDVLRRLGRDPQCSVDALMPHCWKSFDTS